ncbi:hypothetical protein G195_005961 [Phytophthora kernoviae 00238/432]|uniref:Cyclic nucleotide-binding domain-containing protein n=1 Tax=Phytophthora kernoviae 00238/432 TaxID=1284355 RepID=A0A8J4W6K9_9STRA|nr:hypothetical protein G195_005961 [Phytophthora kernoviae 00238/432]
MAYFAHRSGGSEFKLLRRHVLHPHGRIRSIWDTILLVLITWVLLVVPFELCFSMNDSIRRSILHLDLFVDAMFTLDIVLTFNTAVEDDGKLHFSFHSIFRQYTHGWLVPELLWTLPFYAIFESLDPEAYVSGDDELKTRYIAAFYWSMMTMTTVGYGDITVKTNTGRLFSLAAMIVGAGVFAYGITNVVSLFQQLYEDDTAYRRDMDQVNAFMQSRMLSRALRDKVRANTFHWRKAARGENKERDRAIVERMASLIRVKVADRFCEDMMPRKMPFLAGCSSEFIHDLYLRMRVQCYLPGEDIITQGDYGSDMYFLFVGHAQVLLGLTKVALFGPNSCFGEFSIANPRKPRLATIQALDFCETHCIDREQILRILMCHPTTVRSTRQLARLRSRKALTLIYESGAKSRTLLQGLAMVWRADGVQGILPTGVLAESLPFLQEFTSVTSGAPAVGRRSSSIVTPAGGMPHAQLQLNQLHPAQYADQAQLKQLHQLNASTGLHPGMSSAVTTSMGALSGMYHRLSLPPDMGANMSATPGLLAPVSPNRELRVRSAVSLMPPTLEDVPTVIDTPSALTKDAITVRNNDESIRTKPALTRRRSMASPTRIPPSAIPTLLTNAPDDDRMEKILTEIRNVASRQSVLEQQLKEILNNTHTTMHSSYPKLYPKLESLRPTLERLHSKVENGVTPEDSDRFDEQHWINDNAPPIGRQRSTRHIDRLPNPDGNTSRRKSVL